MVNRTETCAGRYRLGRYLRSLDWHSASLASVFIGGRLRGVVCSRNGTHDNSIRRSTSVDYYSPAPCRRERQRPTSQRTQSHDPQPRPVAAAGGFTTDTLAEDCDLTLRILRKGYTVENENAAIAMTEAPETFKQFLKIEPQLQSTRQLDAYARIFVEAGINEDGEPHQSSAVERIGILPPGLTGGVVLESVDQHTDVELFWKNLVRADILERIEALG